MAFDVINYTYSGLISIFSMIMGMAYPLVNTAITEIDAKYGGNRMSEKVLSETTYIRFRAILAVSIVVSILTPFVLYYLKGISGWMYYWVLLQTIVVLLLVIASIQLYDLIIRYKLPKKFGSSGKWSDLTWTHRRQLELLLQQVTTLRGDIASSRPMLTKGCCKGNNYEQNLSLDFPDEPKVFGVLHKKWRFQKRYYLFC